MSIGPMNEILVSITNLVRKSDHGQAFFPFTEEGEEAFVLWQTNLFSYAELVYGHWTENNHIADTAVEWFENEFKKAFTYKE